MLWRYRESRRSGARARRSAMPVNPKACNPHEDRRRAGRIRCTLTTCQYGTVVNLSKSGLRVATRRPISLLPAGASVNLCITAAGQSMVVPARPVHNRPRPDGMFDVGFQFVGLTERTCRELIQLARTAWDAELIHQSQRKAG
ncbi:MAG: PilZ domain-containing protein [Phycisphaerales bacterium]